MTSEALQRLLLARYAGYVFLLRHGRQRMLPQRPVFHTGERQSLGDEGALRMATAEIRQHVSTTGSLAPSAVKVIAISQQSEKQGSVVEPC